jgi:hypothetical protein
MGLDEMKPRHALWTLCLHAGLLVLASTRFTAVSWLWGKWSLSFDYLDLAHSNGWGYAYRSDYSLPVVLAYIGANLAGVAAYTMARGRVCTLWRLPALMLCVLGMLSFSVEASHWLWSHHRSLIASCPAVSLALAIIVGFQLVRMNARPAPSSAAARP